MRKEEIFIEQKIAHRGRETEVDSGRRVPTLTRTLHQTAGDVGWKEAREGQDAVLFFFFRKKKSSFKQDIVSAATRRPPDYVSEHEHQAEWPQDCTRLRNETKK